MAPSMAPPQTRTNAPGDRAAPGGLPVTGDVGAALDLDEQRLIAQVLAGDEAAVTRLVARHQAAMSSLAAAILGGTANAADAVQEAWLRILSGLRQFAGRSSLKTWILRITANVARTAAAKHSRTDVADLSASEPTVDPARFTAIGAWREPPRPWSDGGEQEDALLRRELLRLVYRELEQLPPGQRAVVRLRDVEELDSAEVSELLGLSDANQRVLLHRGRARLRAALARELGRP
ncbi:MAG: RNA polymerase sigma factor [Polyangia bacterium]